MPTVDYPNAYPIIKRAGVRQTPIAVKPRGPCAPDGCTSCCIPIPGCSVACGWDCCATCGHKACPDATGAA